jgi:hypothetical protein
MSPSLVEWSAKCQQRTFSLRVFSSGRWFPVGDVEIAEDEYLPRLARELVST